jgi:hypothetical protein
MTTPRKLTATETMRALETMLEDDEAEREMERILALSPEQVDRELAEAGIDPAAARARGEAIARKAVALAAERKPPPPRRLFSPTTSLLLAAALAALLTWTMAPTIARWVHPPDIGPDAPSPERLAHDDALEQAKALRAAAHDACAALDWAACLEKLDNARTLDPPGDADHAVEDDRRRATDALAHPAPSSFDDKGLPQRAPDDKGPPQRAPDDKGPPRPAPHP